ncbi:aspartate/glutamate racemase family protein [bacterium]|nr:aspartate/glutamate racemase family protein [bacterium]
MRTIGLLGGMSWESTLTYYRLINEAVKDQLGGLHSAKICLYSVDFSEIEKHQHAENWLAAAEILVNAARSVEKAGADFLLICTNTMHKVAAEIEAGIGIPVLHIADATAEVILSENIRTVGLLGTGFTMEQDFYKGRLQEQYGLNVIIPEVNDRKVVHQIIYEELCLGKVEPESRQKYLKIINALSGKGAEGVILGCTEIALLVNQKDTTVPLFDTTAIHARKAAQMALKS